MRRLDNAPGWTQPRIPLRLSRHAWCRTHARRCGVAAVEAAVVYGRVVHVRGAEIHAIGRKEVLRCRQRGIDLRVFEGIQVVCRPGASVVLTVYRNRDFPGAPSTSEKLGTMETSGSLGRTRESRCGRLSQRL